MDNGYYQLWTVEQSFSNSPAKVTNNSATSYFVNGKNHFQSNTSSSNTRREDIYPQTPHIVETYTTQSIPNTTNNQSMEYLRNVSWEFEDGEFKNEFMNYFINQGGHSFIEMNNFTGDCTGYYLDMSGEPNATQIPIYQISYYMAVYDTTQNWTLVDEKYWGTTPGGNIDSGQFTKQVQDMLANSNGRYWITITAVVDTVNGTTSVFDSYYTAYCTNTNEGRIMSAKDIKSLRTSKKIPTVEESKQKLIESGKITTIKENK